jgi:hypothetical protein
LVGFVNDAHPAFGDLPEQLIMELIDDEFEGGHTVMEAQSTAAGKCVDVNLA